MSFANPEKGDPKVGMTILLRSISLVFRQTEELMGPEKQHWYAPKDRWYQHPLQRWLRPEEGQQIGVELVLVRVGQTMGTAGIDLQRRVLDEFRREHCRSRDRHDLIVIAVDDQRRHVDLLQVLSEIRLGEGFDGIEFVLETALHPLEPERVPHALRDLVALAIGAVKRGG